MVKRHKASGWTREALGHGQWKITPTDGSGERVVMFMGAMSWANLPNDRREDQDRDRVVMVTGEPLPEWAAQWLHDANHRYHESGRREFERMLIDADDNLFGGDW